MSKVGKLPISIPAGVTVSLDNNIIKVTGPKGELTLEIKKGIKVQIDSDKLTVTRSSEEKPIHALHGTTRANLANMILGVSTGYKKSLELVGTGYRARLSGGKLILSLGYSHEIEYTAKAGVTIVVEGTNLIHVEGRDKQAVGQTCAEIREYRKPEPYKGKGVKYVGEVIRRKAGKAAKGASA